ncbi:MAG: alginate export family protein [Planctomycetota bacterium]
MAASPFALAQQGGPQQQPPQEPPPGDQKIGELALPGINKLTVTGQWRFRYEGFYDYDFNRDAGPSADFLSQRARIKFDFEATDDINVVFELQDVRNWGEELSTVDDSADGLDFHQAYVQIENMPGIGGTMKAGRQRLVYGDQRIIGGLDWLQQARAFDGVRNRWSDEDGWVDAFVTQIRETFTNATTTAGYSDQYFMGVYAHRKLGEDGYIEPYLLFLQDSGVTAGASQNRGTLGALVKQQLTDELLVGGEFATQFGEQGGADIPFFETFAANIHARLKPRESDFWFGLDLNYATGNDPNSADNERFNNLFPTAHKFWGYMDFATWSNLMHGSVMAGMQFTPKSSLEAHLHTFRSVEETDRLAGPRGTLSNGVFGGSRSMGEEIDVVYKLAIDTGGKSRAHLHIGYGIFLPGAGVEDAFGSDDVAHFAYVETGVLF